MINEHRLMELGQFFVKRHESQWWLWPKNLGEIDFKDPLQKIHPAIIRTTDPTVVENIVVNQYTSKPVEYLGWLTKVNAFGNCGSHPQFEHLKYPPEGWYFLQSAPSYQLRNSSIYSENIDSLIGRLIDAHLIPAFTKYNVPYVLSRDFMKTGLSIIKYPEGYSICPSQNSWQFCNNKLILLCHNYRNTHYNIFQFPDHCLGVHQSEGMIDINYLKQKTFNHKIYVGQDVDEVIRKIELDQENTGNHIKPFLVAYFVKSQFQIWKNEEYYYIAGTEKRSPKLKPLMLELLPLENKDEVTLWTLNTVVDKNLRFSALEDVIKYAGQLCQNVKSIEVGELYNNVPTVLPQICGTNVDIIKWKEIYLTKKPEESTQDVVDYNCVDYVPSLKESVMFCFRMLPFIARCIRFGASLSTTIKFIRSRDIRIQMYLSSHKKPIAFIPSVPFFLGQYPWTIEIEDFISFCFPFVHNGKTNGRSLLNSPYLPCFKALLASPNCRAVITHVKSTAENMPRAFNYKELSKKIFYIPMGVPIPNILPRKVQRSQINILFSSSWHQHENSFYLRGGLDFLLAFQKLAKRFSNVHLVFRSPIPAGAPQKILEKIIEENPNRVSCILHYLPGEEWANMMCNTDIYVLPSARIHIVSILQAMSYGIASILSDGWGITEYVDDGETGLIVKGRYGTATWVDSVTGMLVEDYTHMYIPNNHIIEQILERMTLLVEDESLRKKIGNNARNKVITHYNIENWNKKFKDCLDFSVRRA